MKVGANMSSCVAMLMVVGVGGFVVGCMVVNMGVFSGLCCEGSCVGFVTCPGLYV